MSDLWEKANKVSEIGYKIDSLAGIAELVAERLVDNAESGACWAVAEMLREYSERLEKLSENIMQISRDIQFTQHIQKGKKK
jgi:hypothetical protein